MRYLLWPVRFLPRLRALIDPAAGTASSALHSRLRVNFLQANNWGNHTMFMLYEGSVVRGLPMPRAGDGAVHLTELKMPEQIKKPEGYWEKKEKEMTEEELKEKKKGDERLRTWACDVQDEEMLKRWQPRFGLLLVDFPFPEWPKLTGKLPSTPSGRRLCRFSTCAYSGGVGMGSALT